MRFKAFSGFILIMFMVTCLFAGNSVQENRKTISYEDYIIEIEKSLPELKSNDMDVLSAENSVKKAKSADDISLKAGGSAYSNKEYSGITDSGDVKGYNYYAGLSKTVTSTGTSLSTEYNYSKNSYSNFSTPGYNYTSFEPSISVKLTQPLLYNFFGKVDRYSENNAKMKLEIAKSRLTENNRSVLNSYRKLYFQWVQYNEIVKNLDEAIKNSNILKAQIKRKVDAGLADNDDYQGSVTSVLSYELQRRDYKTALKNIENKLSMYMDITSSMPDKHVFNEYVEKVHNAELAEVDFKNTTSAKIMDLTMKNYAYSKGVYENKLLPELNVFTQMTGKDLSGSQTYGAKDTDYSVGFEFKYYLGNNSAESNLKEIEIQIRSLEYEYRATQNTYRKSLLGYLESIRGITDQLSMKSKTLKAMESKLVTEKKKYNQARLNLSYVIETGNSITSERNNILSLKFQLIGYYIDYLDLTM